jgi:hypothetical protein
MRFMDHYIRSLKYYIGYKKTFEKGRVRYVLAKNGENSEYVTDEDACTCAMPLKMGLPCPHIIALRKIKGLDYSTSIRSRWLIGDFESQKNTKKKISEESSSSEEEESENASEI